MVDGGGGVVEIEALPELPAPPQLRKDVRGTIAGHLFNPSGYEEHMNNRMAFITNMHARWDLAEGATVSYTHLTLPTIRSV